MKTFILVCLVLFTTSTAQALITFVDAWTDNTTLDGAALVEGVNYTTSSGQGALDGLWHFRTRATVNGGGIWSSDAGGDENTEPLVTTFTIPAPGIYDIYGLFWINGGGTGHFDCAFSVGSDGPYIHYNKLNATAASANDFVGTVLVIDGDIYMFKAVIGRVTTTTYNESVSVYVQGLPGLGGDERTWYDGVGYQTFESAFASTPNPGDWQTGVAHDVVLSWLPGIYASSHNVYFGADFNDVNDADRLAGDVDGNGQVNLFDVQELVQKWLGNPEGSEPYVDLNDDGNVNLFDFAIVANDWKMYAPAVYKGNQYSNSYDPCGLEPATYYWRIDEVNDANVWKGCLWRFSISPQMTALPGWDIFNHPGGSQYNYRYGPSIIINDDNSIDMWCASPGNGSSEWDWIRHKKSYDGGHTWGSETIVLRPTPGSADRCSCCDPGVIKFGGYYYIGYTSIAGQEDENNAHVFVARSTSPTGGFEKWNGSGWGGNPQPFIVYEGPLNHWGAGEPSFVVKDGTLYIYYTWSGTNETRVATASASDPDWPGNITYHGMAISRVGQDSADVKYIDAMERFIGIAVANRFQETSYIRVWESTNGLTFTPIDEVTDYIQAYAHNTGISGTPQCHIDLNDENFIAYAYGPNWGCWHTHLNPITLE